MRFTLRCGGLWTLWRWFGQHASSVFCGGWGQCLWTERPWWWFQLLKKWTKGCDSIIRGDTLSLLEKAHFSFWTRDFIQLTDLGFKRSNADSILVVEQWTAERSQPINCFVDLEKAYDFCWIVQEFGVLEANRSLYNQSKSYVCILGRRSSAFLVGVELHQGSALSPVMFVIFTDRISRCSQGMVSVRYGGLRITSVFLWMMWFCWLHHTVTTSVYWDSLRSSMKGRKKGQHFQVWEQGNL